MSRRSTALAASVAALLTAALPAVASPMPEGQIMTVRGPIRPAEWGRVLPHEHIAGAFVPRAMVTHQYVLEDVVASKLPQLLALKERGFTGLVETTPADLSRAPDVLLAIAERADMHVVTVTGNYGAFGGAFTAPEVLAGTADDAAALWIAEFENGIDGTDIRPGLIKISVDEGPLSEQGLKLVQAAARAHLATGMPIGLPSPTTGHSSSLATSRSSSASLA